MAAAPGNGPRFRAAAAVSRSARVTGCRNGARVAGAGRRPMPTEPWFSNVASGPGFRAVPHSESIQQRKHYATCSLVERLRPSSPPAKQKQKHLERVSEL